MLSHSATLVREAVGPDTPTSSREARAALNRAWDALSAEHDSLKRYKFRVNGRLKSRLGQCVYWSRTVQYEVQLAKWLVDSGEWPEILDTFLHEVAHALAGPGVGHGFAWKRQARALGCSAARTCQDENLWKAHAPAAKTPRKWGVRCLGCDRILARRKRRPSQILKTHVSNCCSAKLGVVRLGEED